MWVPRSYWGGKAVRLMMHEATAALGATTIRTAAGYPELARPEGESRVRAWLRRVSVRRRTGLTHERPYRAGRRLSDGTIRRIGRLPRNLWLRGVISHADDLLTDSSQPGTRIAREKEYRRLAG